MAIRLSNKVFQSQILSTHRRWCFSRPLNLAQSITVDQPLIYDDEKPIQDFHPEPHHPDPSPETPPPPSSSSSILDLNDAQKLFASVPTIKLLKSATTLQMAAMDPMVGLGLWVMRSRLMNTPLIGDVIQGVVKHTFYEQFVAGESFNEAGKTIRTIHEAGLKGMLVYGSEHAHDELSCEKNYQSFMDTIEFTKTLPPSSVSFVIVKISAIVPIHLLERVSHLLRWEKRNPSSSLNLPWKKNTLPIFGDSSPLYHTQQQPTPLTPSEEHDLELGHNRLSKLCQRCSDLNVPLTIDAEDTIVQPAIDYLTYSSAINYNNTSNNKPIVYGTIQAYLKDAGERMSLASTAAQKMGIQMGFKLVRGAYMSSESKLAASLGYDSPIHDSIQDTHDCFNGCASYLIDKASDGCGAVVLATHNVESGVLAAKKAKDLGMCKENERLQFAQLYGMSEALSNGLNNAGFNVSKYLTFGPMEEVMPYLLRRAEENRGMLSSSTLDRQLMWKEVKRRIMASGRSSE